MKVLCIGDPHFKSDNGEETAEMGVKIEALINERRPDIVVILGDILHRHEKIDLHPLYRAINFLENIHKCLMNYGGFLYIIIGNHDRSNNTVFMTDEHAFNPLKKWENTFVADKVLIHKTEKFNNIICPYVEPGKLKKAISTIENTVENDEYTDFFKDNITMVFAHQEFEGAKMNTITSNVGDQWEQTLPLCVSGHIHDYQKVKNNLIYTGTPIQHGFADTTRKTISYFLLDPAVKKSYTEERINLGIKGKRQFNVRVEDFVKSYINFIEASAEYYVKIKVIGSKKAIKELVKRPEYKKVSTTDGIKFNFLELDDISISEEKTAKPLVSFRSRLLEELSNHKDLRPIFCETFKTDY